MTSLRVRSMMVLVIPALFIGHLIQSRAAQHESCAEEDLSLYTSRSYATEEETSRRCRLIGDIERDGRLTPGDLRVRVRHELSKRFAIRINFSGEVGLPRAAIDYLLGNMPETAALVSAYSDKDYRATQTRVARDRGRFFVTNNDTFAAGFTYLYTRPRPEMTEHMFFESGFAKVLFWRVWGNSLIHYRLRPDGPDESRYDIEVHVFTDSRLLRTLLRSGPFRYFAQSMFDGILEDVETAVGMFAADSNPARALPPYFVMGLKRTLRPGPAEATPRERRIPQQYREALQ